MSGFVSVGFPVLIAALLIVTGGAIQCNCFNGRVIDDRCTCGCDPGYLPPTCTFGVTDSVPLVFYVNRSATTLVVELFVDAVTYAAAANATFASGKNVAAFNATTIVLRVPGYAVARLLTSVTVRDPWVAQFDVVSAFVITPSISSTSGGSAVSFDTVLYNSGNVIITVNSVLWIVLSVVVVLLLVGSEQMLSTNVEELVNRTALKHRRSSRKLSRTSLTAVEDDGAGSNALMKTKSKEVMTNLNEHRRPALPPSVSLPMQILDDFVDSDDDETLVSHPSAKYSLGRSKGSGGTRGSGTASPKSISSPKEQRRAADVAPGSPKSVRSASPRDKQPNSSAVLHDHLFDTGIERFNTRTQEDANSE